MHKRFYLEEILAICESGKYITKSGKECSLQLSKDQMCWARFIPPEEIYPALDLIPEGIEGQNKCRIEVWNMDCLDAAYKLKESPSTRVAVLNFSNPLSPGGAIKTSGWVAQEEGICARSTAFLSLTSDRASGYYDYNRQYYTFAGNDGVLLSKYVEVIKNNKGENIEPYLISLVSMAAPQCSPISHSLEDKTPVEMERIWLLRVRCLLTVLALCRYRKVILGAFGCGVFANPPERVARAFHTALITYGYRHYFDHVVFSITSTSEKASQNYEVFREIFEGEEA